MGKKQKLFSLAVITFSLIFSSTSLCAQSFSATSSRPLCQSISAKKISPNKIKITWTLPEDFSAKTIALFRAESPIKKDFITSQKPLAELPATSTRYTDSPTHFGRYYYAVIARDKAGSLFNVVFPTVNATQTAVLLLPDEDYFSSAEETEEKQYRPGNLREVPLPYLAMESGLNEKPNKMSPEAKDVAKKLSGKYAKKRPKILPPYIFEEDMIESPQGDDYFLFQSLKTYFIKKDYKSSAKDLTNFLAMNREQKVTTRAAFYLGQSEYYCKNYKKALELFLFVEDELPELSKKWIDSTLDFYQIPSESR